MIGVVVLGLLSAGCTADTDCKADRVCVSGTCVLPSEAPPPPPPPLDSATEVPPPPVEPSVSTSGAGAQGSGFVADFGAMGSLILDSANGGVGALPGFGLHAGLGGRLNPLLALGGSLNVQLGFGSGFLVGVFSLGPSLRVGNASHATVTLGPTVLFLSTDRGSGTGFAGSLLIHGVVLLAGAFGLHLQGGVHINDSGVLFTLGVGVGGSVI